MRNIFRICQIKLLDHSELDSGWADNKKVTERPLSFVIWEEFNLVAFEEVDRILGAASSATCVLDPCSFDWLVKGDGMCLTQAVINISL